VSSVLILREDVTPEFLVLLHELEDGLPIPLFFIDQIDEDDLFGPEWGTCTVFYQLVRLSLAIQLVVLGERSVLDAELLLSPFDFDSQALLTLRRRQSELFLLGLLLLLAFFFEFLDSFELLDSLYLRHRLRSPCIDVL